MIRDVLKVSFSNSNIGIAGVFKIKSGEIRSHLEYDYKDCPEDYYNNYLDFKNKNSRKFLIIKF